MMGRAPRFRDLSFPQIAPGRAAPFNWDSLNQRRVYPSSNRLGLPTVHTEDMPAPRALVNYGDKKERIQAPPNSALHFFIDDYRFESVWNKPEDRLWDFRRLAAVITPDFSFWPETPRAAQMWQVYRAAWLGAFWQSEGIWVIPSLTWADEATWSWCFDFIEPGGTVAVSPYHARRTALDREFFAAGLAAGLRATRPSRLLVYGKLPAECGEIEVPVTEYPTYWQTRHWEHDKG